MVTVGFLNPDTAPTEEVKSSLPSDLEAPPLERREKNILIFCDESAFQANGYDPRQWGTAESQVLRPKSKGSGIMVSDFVNETIGYLRLTKE